MRGRLCLPNTECAVCHNHRALVHGNPDVLCLRTVLGDLLEDFIDQLRQQQQQAIEGHEEGEGLLPNLDELVDGVSVLEGSRIIYDADSSSEALLDRSLTDLGVSDGSLLRIDFLDGPALILGVIKEYNFHSFHSDYQSHYSLVIHSRRVNIRPSLILSP